MPEQEPLSILHLIFGAGPVVLAVMGILFSASVISWIVIFQRAIYQNKASRHFVDFERQFWSGIDLTQLYRQGNTKAVDGSAEGIESIFRSGFKEFTRLRQQAGVDADAIMEGAQRAMRVAAAKEQEKLEAGLPFLASVASVSPYIGLFGTVWGILNSFRGLAMQGQATIATVAPGISEALVATAIGLFAAIPAVLAYNRFAAKAETLSSNYATFAEELSSILHRQAHAR
jgi:biopolymer transport protein TolQ